MKNHRHQRSDVLFIALKFVPVLSALSVLLLGICFGWTSEAYAQSKYAKNRYGAYPIVGSGLAVLKHDLASDTRLIRSNRSRCANRSLNKKAKECDADRDGISNGFEKRLLTNHRNIDSDADGLRERAELIKYHTNPLLADTDGDGLSDGEEVLTYLSDPNDVTDPGLTNPTNPFPCPTPNFDLNGNTSAFGIPIPQVGNITRGQQAYSLKCSACHMNIDKGTNLSFPSLKTRLSQAPMFITNIDTPTLSDLVSYLNRTQVGGTGQCETPTPSTTSTPAPNTTMVPSATATPSGPTCVNQYFDAFGNTAQFGIPSPIVGNLTRGGSYYSTSCASCHADRGVGFTYSQMKTAVTGPLMNISTVTDLSFADLTAYANRNLANVGCGGTPTPNPGATATSTPIRTPIPTATPYTSTCSNQYFDASGNTNQFGITSPLIGNLNQGSSLYNLSCTGCHGERGTNFNYTQLKTAVTGPLMKITTVSDQQYAHLTAYLNRSRAPQSCGTPLPTPTPLDDISSGRIVYQVTCQTCHSRPTEFRRLTSNGLREAIAEKPQMRSIALSTEQVRVLLLYLHSL